MQASAPQPAQHKASALPNAMCRVHRGFNGSHRRGFCGPPSQDHLGRTPGADNNIKGGPAHASCTADDVGRACLQANANTQAVRNGVFKKHSTAYVLRKQSWRAAAYLSHVIKPLHLVLKRVKLAAFAAELLVCYLQLFFQLLKFILLLGVMHPAGY